MYGIDVHACVACVACTVFFVQCWKRPTHNHARARARARDRVRVVSVRGVTRRKRGKILYVKQEERQRRKKRTNYNEQRELRANKQKARHLE